MVILIFRHHNNYSSWYDHRTYHDDNDVKTNNNDYSIHINNNIYIESSSHLHQCEHMKTSDLPLNKVSFKFAQQNVEHFNFRPTQQSQHSQRLTCLRLVVA